MRGKSGEGEGDEKVKEKKRERTERANRNNKRTNETLQHTLMYSLTHLLCTSSWCLTDRFPYVRLGLLAIVGASQQQCAQLLRLRVEFRELRHLRLSISRLALCIRKPSLARTSNVEVMRGKEGREVSFFPSLFFFALVILLLS